MFPRFVECRKCGELAIPQNNAEICTSETCKFEYSVDGFDLESSVLLYEEIGEFLKVARMVNNL
jgi:hypothetical protein